MKSQKLNRNTKSRRATKHGQNIHEYVFCSITCSAIPAGWYHLAGRAGFFSDFTNVCRIRTKSWSIFTTGASLEAFLTCDTKDVASNHLSTRTLAQIIVQRLIISFDMNFQQAYTCTQNESKLVTFFMLLVKVLKCSPCLILVAWFGRAKQASSSSHRYWQHFTTNVSLWLWCGSAAEWAISSPWDSSNKFASDISGNG